jgi:hypothetical protein
MFIFGEFINSQFYWLSIFSKRQKRPRKKSEPTNLSSHSMKSVFLSLADPEKKAQKINE